MGTSPLAEGKYLKGVRAETDAASFLSNFDNETLEICGPDGQPLGAEFAGFIGTGFKVRSRSADGKVADELTVVIAGEVNGDGRINALDRRILARSLTGGAGEKIKDRRAADVNGDGTVNALDSLILARVLAKWEGYLK